MKRLDRRMLLRPAVALPVLLAVIAAAAILTPQQSDPRDGDSRLSSYSVSPMGARLLYRTAEHLGWPVSRRREAGVPADPRAVIVLLDPTVPPTARQAHAILEHVRAGGGLLHVYGDGTLTDSLHVRRGEGAPARVPGDVRGAIDERCAAEGNGALPLWPTRDMQLYHVVWRRRPDGPVVTFAETIPDAGEPRRADRARARPAAVGFALGQGRVVAIADPDLLRNDVLRVCRWGADVAAVRMLEYLGRGARRPLVFHEFHLGYGAHPGTFTAIATFFSRTTAGHVLAQLVVAALILLLARAPRLVPPRDDPRVERRSPTEHVEALGRAYEEVGATRTATLRLLQGVRRRVARQGAPPLTGDEGAEPFLAWVLHRVPGAEEDVRVLRHALEHPVPVQSLAGIGGAVRRIEAMLGASLRLTPLAAPPRTPAT